MAEEAPAIGIDLGTTYSCVGVWKNGRVEIITNEQGNRITPSCVAFNEHERLIGDGALNQISKNPTNTIFDAKRLIGRRYSEESVKNDKALWPFEVIAGDNDKPTIIVQYQGEEKRFSLEEISSMILSKLKGCAETYLGCAVEKAVVTVPAYFNNSQRQSTKDAGLIAGLDVIHVLNEPTAAALAYGLDNKHTCRDGRKKRIIIFDFGGGTFDVSLLDLDEHGVLDVIATAGDTHLGGQDLDNRMVNHLVEIFRIKHGRDISNNPRCIRRLKTACEKAKRILSNATVTDITVDCLFEGIDFHRSFSRVKFEELNVDLFERLLEPLGKCLEDAKVNMDSVDEVVLVGGSTRIPKVQEMLRGFFNGKTLNNNINPDEAVAYGASIQAASLNRSAGQRGPEVVLLDVTPLSLGLSDSHGVMNVVIPRNTRIPCVMHDSWVTSKDYQQGSLFRVFEGERPIADDNNLLGKFYLDGLRLALKGEVKFHVIFEIDDNGILHVSARNRDNGDRANITISPEQLTLNKHEIDRMIRDAKGFEAKDKQRKRAILAKHELEEYASRISKLIVEPRIASRLRAETSEIKIAIKLVMDWLEGNAAAAHYEYEHQKASLKRAWEPIRMKLEIAGIGDLGF